MKAVARAAFLHGLWVGGFAMGGTINLVNSFGLAMAGDTGFSVVTFFVAMVMLRMGWREWKLHRRGMANLQ